MSRRKRPVAPSDVDAEPAALAHPVAEDAAEANQDVPCTQVVPDAVRWVDGARVITEAGLGVIERMRAKGHTLEAMAAALGLSRRTLLDIRGRDERVQAALARGHAALEDLLLSELLERAKRSDMLLMFALNNLLGMKANEPRDGTAAQVNIQQVFLPAPARDLSEYRRQLADAIDVPGDAAGAPDSADAPPSAPEDAHDRE